MRPLPLLLLLACDPAPTDTGDTSTPIEDTADTADTGAPAECDPETPEIGGVEDLPCVTQVLQCGDVVEHTNEGPPARLDEDAHDEMRCEVDVPGGVHGPERIYLVRTPGLTVRVTSLCGDDHSVRAYRMDEEATCADLGTEGWPGECLGVARDDGDGVKRWVSPSSSEVERDWMIIVDGETWGGYRMEVDCDPP